ncbi:hypothetical protein [Demequina sp.]|uniref:hypothetical protein n=1 Tax=Demequina sp. TaxID=2050685 RepID=UPI003D124F2B
MTSDVMNAGPGAAATLLRSWESASVSSVWLRPGDWYTPAAEALVEALEAGKDTAPAAFRLGQARAAAGVGITEAIDDMTVLFRAAGFQTPPIRSIRSLCEGWTERDLAPIVAPTMTDAESGLGTGEYLVQRLAEVYGMASRSNTKVSQTHALVIVDVSVSDNDPWQRIARNAAVGHALKDAYGDGHPMARLSDGIYAVLVVRDANLGTGLSALRDHIAERSIQMRVGNLMRQPPRVWVESLPDAHAHVQDLLESVFR